MEAIVAFAAISTWSVRGFMVISGAVCTLVRLLSNQYPIYLSRAAWTHKKRPQAVVCQIPYYIYNIFFHPLAKFPGPKLWAASRIPHELAYCRGRIITKLSALHEKYGEVVRVSPTALSFIHPDAWIDVYTRKQGQKLFPKDPSRYGKMMWVDGAPDIFSADDEAVHDRLRRLLIPVFSDKVPGDQEALIQGHVDILINRLGEKAHDPSSQGKIDISAWLNWATFDMIGDLAFGEPFGCLQAGEYHPWVALVFDNVKAVSIMSAIKQFPWIDAVIQYLLSGVMARAIRHHQALTIEKVDRRLEKKTRRGDFMDVILMHRGTDKEMTRNEIYANSNLLIMAGSESSAAAMAGLLYYLDRYPEANRRLKNDIRSKFSSEKEISIEAVAELPYLTAVLQEAMRIYPPQPVFTPRVAPVGGGMVMGHFVPENTQIGIYQTVAYRAKHNFRHPEFFHPSRWLNDPLYAADRKEIFKPFGIGPKSCIAKQLAFNEMRLIVTHLLWNFDFEVAEESKAWIEQKAYWTWHRPALMMKLTERNETREIKEG